MDNQDKKRIEQQLLSQASVFTSNADDIELITSALLTSQALLRIAEKAMPADISGSDYEDVFSAYLGISSRIKNFYNNNIDKITSEEASLLTTQMNSIEECQKRKSDLDDKLDKARQELAVINQAVSKSQSQINETSKACDEANDKVNSLTKLSKNLSDQKKKLENESNKLQSDIDEYESQIETIVKRKKDLTSAYEDLTTYYSEFERIKKGIVDDGFVDVNSFNEAAADLVEEIQITINKGDDFLNTILNDVDEVEKKIEKKQQSILKQS